MILLALRETYALNRLSSFKNLRRKVGKFDHRPGRPEVLLRHWPWRRRCAVEDNTTKTINAQLHANATQRRQQRRQRFVVRCTHVVLFVVDCQSVSLCDGPRHSNSSTCFAVIRSIIILIIVIIIIQHSHRSAPSQSFIVRQLLYFAVDVCSHDNRDVICSSSPATCLSRDRNRSRSATDSAYSCTFLCSVVCLSVCRLSHSCSLLKPFALCLHFPCQAHQRLFSTLCAQHSINPRFTYLLTYLQAAGTLVVSDDTLCQMGVPDPQRKRRFGGRTPAKTCSCF